MFVAFRDVGALDDALGAFLHAAVAGDGDFAGGTIGAGEELPACSSAEGAILESHGDSIRLRGLDGKVPALGKLWKGGGRRRKAEEKDGEERRRRKTEKKDGEERRRRAVILGRMTLHGGPGRGAARTMAWGDSFSC